MNFAFRGVVTPILTPHADDHSIAEDLYLSHAADCLAGGAHYLSPFGTTGEATSHTARERRHILELLVSSGTARADQLMPGTGLCALQETADLCLHAADLGCAAVMVLPPFFYSAPSDEGLYAAYAALIERMGAACPKIILYNIPQNTGVPISPALSHRLNAAFPEIVVAYKDSSGDWANTQAVMAAAPAVAMFPASESLLAEAIKLGAAGCISASCNSNLAAIRSLYDAASAGDWGRVQTLQPGIDRHRQALQKAGLINGLKALKAHRSGDARWLNMRPPHLRADPALGTVLSQTLAP